VGGLFLFLFFLFFSFPFVFCEIKIGLAFFCPVFVTSSNLLLFSFSAQKTHPGMIMDGAKNCFFIYILFILLTICNFVLTCLLCEMRRRRRRRTCRRGEFGLEFSFCFIFCATFSAFSVLKLLLTSTYPNHSTLFFICPPFSLSRLLCPLALD